MNKEEQLIIKNEEWKIEEQLIINSEKQRIKE